MKKIFCYGLTTIILLLSYQAWAIIPTMQLRWTVSDTTGLDQVKLYYGYSNDMADKTWHQSCSSPTEETAGKFTMTCTDIAINNFPAYIQVGALYSDGSEILSNIQTIAEDPTTPPGTPAPPSMVQDFRIVPATQPPPAGTVFYWAMESLPEPTLISDVGNVTITRHDQPATLVPGTSGNGLEQTGTWQTYRFPMSVVPTNKGTITLWVKHAYPPDINDATSRYFFTSTNRDQANSLYAYTYKNNLYFYLYDGNGILHRTYKVADTWQTGVWYKYEFNWDSEAGTMEIQRNGKIISESTTSSWNRTVPIWNSESFFVGYNDPIGSFDELYISDN